MREKLREEEEKGGTQTEKEFLGSEGDGERGRAAKEIYSLPNTGLLLSQDAQTPVSIVS